MRYSLSAVRHVRHDRRERQAHGSMELQADKDVVMAAVKQNGEALRFASKELQKDEEVVLAAEKQEEEAREKRST